MKVVRSIGEKFANLSTTGTLAALALLALVLGANPAAAQSAPDLDVATGMTAARDAFVTKGQTSITAAFGLLGLLLAVGFAWKWLKRGAKSS